MHKKIVITGGGSGGHLSSASAIIDTLIEDKNYPIESIVYVGGDLGMEGEKAGNSLEQREYKDKPFKKYFIRAGKFQRRISLTTVRLLLRSFLGFFDSISILLKEKPDLVISTGGFVSVPVCKVAWILRIPIYLHEQTATVGLSNKIVGVFAKRVYISFKDSAKYFPKSKVLHVGNNVRKVVFKKDLLEGTDRRIVKMVNNKSQYPLIYVSGGSLGSHLINQKIINNLEPILEKYSVILQTGDNKLFKEYELATELHNTLSEDKKERFLPLKYLNEQNIGYVLNNMDLFIGRSGANTVYEVGVLKKNALFIPIPWVTHNEQYLNAKVLEDIGTAKILEEKHLKDANLLEEIDRFRKQIELRKVDYKLLQELFPINASVRLLEDILSSQN